jgi:hypothetical protein
MKKLLPFFLFLFAIQFLNAQNVGIGTTAPTSKLHVNGQVAIDQKNFGGYGGLLIRGGTSTANYPNIVFSILNNAIPQADVISAYFGGIINNDASGSESMDLVFLTTQTGFSGLSEKLRIKDNGNIGIGLNPSYKLHVGNATNGLRVEGPATAGGTAFSMGGLGILQIDKPGIIGGRLTILENGNTGIGNNSPNALLQLGNSITNRKIVLFDQNNDDHQYYGFGINGGALRYQVSNTISDHIFYAGTSSSTSNELLRIKGNGAIAVNGNIGTAGQVLTSNGTGVTTWSNTTNTNEYNSFIELATPTTSSIAIAAGTIAYIPGLSHTLVLTKPSLVTISYQLTMFGASCAFCADPFAEILLENNAVNNYLIFTQEDIGVDKFRTITQTRTFKLLPNTYNLKLAVRNLLTTSGVISVIGSSNYPSGNPPARAYMTIHVSQQ